MEHSSQKLALDNRLLAMEELLRQRRFSDALREFDLLVESDFVEHLPDLGLYHSLKADCLHFSGSYKESLEAGLNAVKILAVFSLNRRYARALLVTSKAYFSLGDLKNAEIRSRDALGSYRRAGDTAGQIDALNLTARVKYTRCDYPSAAALVDEAILLAVDNPRQIARLTGNVGAIRVYTGNWKQAEENLAEAISYHREQGEEMSLAFNYLSMSALHIRRREFLLAGRVLGDAFEIIDRLDLKREKILYLEYSGELAFAKGDFTRAKHILGEAVHRGKLIAPDSALVSQSERLLAEVELALENIDEAMTLAQRTLELATRLGEATEVGLAMRLIARIFAFRSEFPDAKNYINNALDQLRQVGDPIQIARTLLSRAEILLDSADVDEDEVRRIYEEAEKIYKELSIEYWLAETHYRAGMFSCRQGKLSAGFVSLSKAENLFSSAGDGGKIRSVRQFLSSLAEQAVALSVSEDNKFKAFGNLLSQDEITDLRSGAMDEVLEVVMNRTNADRVVIHSVDSDTLLTVDSMDMTSNQMRRFSESFQQMLGEEVSLIKPTLMLDCRRDPYINGLFAHLPEIISSMAVIPFKQSDLSTCYLCIFKLSTDGSLNPFSQDELNFAVGFSDLIAFRAAELQKMKLLEDNRRLKAQLLKEAAFPNIITRNKKMLEMLSYVRQVVDSSISVSIEGETGSGKDILAKAIHYNSIRRDKRFISVNCAALPETLLESELFGYQRGAFTGADRDKPGLFEEADGGTFFLDEIADMPLSVQAKILRVLEAKEIVRLGESVPRPVDVRILSATNKNLKEEMAKGTFRNDLYYRLTALTFRLPALRERKEDIPLLVDHFLNGVGKSISAETLKLLVAYDWPGNIRELDNEVKKLVLLSGEADEILPETLSAQIRSGIADDHDELPDDRSLPLDQVRFNEQYSLYDYLAGYEKEFIIRALKEHNGVKKHAAASLNIPESTLRLKIKQYDISSISRDSVN